MNNKKIFNYALKYLLSFPQITQEILLKQCSFPQENVPKSLNELFNNLLGNAQNKRGMPNSIGDINNLKGILFDFDPLKVNKNYLTWEALFDKIKNDYRSHSRMEKNNSHNYWVIYCQAILSIAKFVNRFSSIESFNKYIQEFISSNTDVRIALPLILKEEIFGFGFALACDFLKEHISPEYVKPDTHIRDIFIGLEISNQNASDFEIFRDAIDFSKSIKELPYKVDKVFWLIGSGNFYYEKIKIKTDKFAFIEKFKKENF